MAKDINKARRKKTREKDPRASFTLHMNARQGDLLKEILCRELTTDQFGPNGAKAEEVSEILASVQNALDQLEYFVKMRNSSEKDEL